MWVRQEFSLSSPCEIMIVGCIRNINLTLSWEGLFGLFFGNDRLLAENGGVCDRFLDYKGQKCLEGPIAIDGYVEGKRLAVLRLLGAVTEAH